MIKIILSSTVVLSVLSVRSSATQTVVKTADEQEKHPEMCTCQN